MSSLQDFVQQELDHIPEESIHTMERKTVLRKDEEMTAIDIPGYVEVLQSPTGAQIYLIGTAHVSKDSLVDVIQLIDNVRPDTVFVELCKERTQLLYQKGEGSAFQLLGIDLYDQSGDSILPEPAASPSFLSMYRTRGSKMLPHYLLSYLYKRMVKQLDVMPGAEFQAAMIGAIKCQSRLVFGDRLISVTLQRAMNCLTLWDKLKLGYSIFFSEQIEEEDVKLLGNTDIMTLLMETARESFPHLVQVLLDERDQVMKHHLQHIEGENIVAVVGRGHVRGIVDSWDQVEPIDQYTNIPPPIGYSVKWLLIPILLILLYIFYILGSLAFSTFFSLF